MSMNQKLKYTVNKKKPWGRLKQPKPLELPMAVKVKVHAGKPAQRKLYAAAIERQLNRV